MVAGLSAVSQMCGIPDGTDFRALGAQLEGGPRSRTELASRSGSARSSLENAEAKRRGGGGEGRVEKGRVCVMKSSCTSSSLARPPSLLLSYSGLAQSVSGPCVSPEDSLKDLPYGREVIAHGGLVGDDWVT